MAVHKTSFIVLQIFLYSTRCIAISTPTTPPFVQCSGSSSHTCLSDGLCLPLSLQCDGQAQCKDASDEADCENRCLGPDWFRCHNDHCISADWKCDGENDCMDWSDEEDSVCKAQSTMASPYSKLPCGPEQFTCSDGSCIPSLWTCDRQPDCHGGEDEGATLCKDRKKLCGENQFTCTDGGCISKSWVCDKYKDCEDASDEAVNICSDNDTLSCDVQHGSFLCKDGSFCLDAPQVCDNVPDCTDQSDEGDFCIAKGCENPESCEQGCLPTVSGHSCFCYPGYILDADQRKCLDVDECQQFGACSQICINTPGSFNCSCQPGYSITNGSCLSTSPETLLLFSTKTEVRGLNLTDNRYFSVARNLPHVIGVGYDSKEARVYWTDVMAGVETIHSSNIDGTGMLALVNSGLDMPEDLVVDEVSRNLYFTDSISKHLAVCNIDGTSSCAVLARDMEQPRAIALHHDRQLVLFTDWGTNTKCIGMLGMDGTNPRGLVTEHLGWPNGLAVDEVLDRIYWSDATLDLVESIKLDGTDRRIVLQTIVKHPFSLDVFEDRLYWSDWENQDIMSCNKFTGKDARVHVKEVGVRPYGITVSNPVRSSVYYSPCWPTSPCSHICLPSTASYRCLCPAHLILLPDRKTCSASLNASSFLLSTGRQLYQIYPQTIGLGEFTHLATLPDGQFEAIDGNGVDNTVLILNRETGGNSDIFRLDRNQRKLQPTGTGSLISTISFDPRSRTIFCTDLHKMAIMARSMVTGGTVEIVSGLYNPLALLVVPEHNRLVLGEQGKLSLLQLGPQDLSTRSIVSTALTRPSSLAYSSSFDALYIGDPGARAIFRWSWGSNNLIPVMQNIGEVTSLATKDNFLYWVEEGKNVVYWVTLEEGSKEISLMFLSNIASSIDLLHITVSGNNSSPSLNMGCLSASCSHLCIPGDASSITCGCPYGMDLATDGLTCSQPKLGCPDFGFSCGDGQCILQGWRCDGTSDCANSADEANCTTLASTSICNATDQVTCSNGDCLQADWWCDGDIDCIDGSDESPDCPTVLCEKDRFQCKDGKQCVVSRWKCDGESDCSDGSDEEGCGPVQCGTGQFACTDGLLCIQQSWRCDDFTDCQDSSDEADCTMDPVGCTENEFECDNGNCVDRDLLCDTVDDCWDRSDEGPVVCSNGTESIEDSLPEVEVICVGGFKCGSQCLDSSVHCNGTWECPDYSDEADCPLCTSDTFSCNNGDRCVPRSWTCDEVLDCTDGSDEWDCEYLRRTTEPSAEPCDTTSEFQCVSGECVSLDRTCNGVTDCVDGSDEDSQACYNACSSRGHPSRPSSQCGPEEDCHPTPRGPVCLCRDGYQVSATSSQCQDRDECQLLSSCAQLCTNTKGSFKCSCEEGFQSESSSCRPVGLQPKFLYALGNTIRSVSDGPHGHKAVHEPLTTHAKPVASFVLDGLTGDLYWSSPGLDIIGKRPHGPVTLVRNEVWLAGLDRPAELAMDWRVGNLYYSSQRHAHINVCNIARKKCKVVATAPEDAVTKIAVDPRAGLLFVAGYSRKPGTYPSSHIYPFTMDGKSIHSVIGSEKTGMVSGLALDPVKKLVFWSDLTSRDIGVCSYQGSHCSVVVTSSQSRPAGLAMFTSKLFWTTGNFGWLHSHQTISNVTVERTLHLPLASHSLTFSHSTLQPTSRYPNPCLTLACPHLCLLSSPTTATCACPTGFHTLANSSSCLAPDSNQTLPASTTTPLPTWKNVSEVRDGPSVVLITQDSSTSIAVIVLFVILLILVPLCLVFLKFRRTKQGADMGIRFTNMGFGIQPSNDACVELDDEYEVAADKVGTSIGFDNPGFASPMSVVSRAIGQLSMNSPGNRRWTGRQSPRDNDSAFQEPPTPASSYEDESEYLSADEYKDKHRLL